MSKQAQIGIHCPEEFHSPGHSSLEHITSPAAEFDGEADCSRKLYSLAAVFDGYTLNETEQALGRGWPPTGEQYMYCLSPFDYDEDNVTALISACHAAISGDYTIYEVFAFGITSTRVGTPTSASAWWSVIYQDLDPEVYYGDTESWDGQTLLELEARGMIS